MTTKNKSSMTTATSATVAPLVSALGIFDRFKAVSEVKPILIKCKGWGEVYALPMTVADAESARSADPEQLRENTNAKALMLVMCDADGNRVFDVKNPDHLAIVLKQPQDYLISFLSQVNKVLGTSEEGVADTKKG